MRLAQTSVSFTAVSRLYALTYIVMFAIPLFGLRGITARPPLWLRVASFAGLAMTLLYVILSVFLIIAVASVAGFALEVSLVILAANVLGSAIFVAGRRTASIHQVAAD